MAKRRKQKPKARGPRDRKSVMPRGKLPPPEKTMPDRKKQASRDACRRPADEDDDA